MLGGIVGRSRLRLGALCARLSHAALGALAGLLVSQPWSANAQVPGAAQPGQIEREIDRRPAVPPPSQRIEVPKAPEPVVPSGAQSIRFRLDRVNVDGVTVYTPAELAASWSEMTGKDVSLADVYALAQRLTVRYRNDGFILSRVIVPEQRVADGVVRLQAIEGFVDKVLVEGALIGDRARVEAVLRKISEVRPLTARALERYLLLINDLAGVSARAVLRPSGAAQGGADLAVLVSQAPFSASAELNNRGSESLGPWRVEADLAANSLFGGFGQSRAVVVSTFDDELRLLALSHEQFVGTEGTRVAVFASTAASKPDVESTLGVLYKTRSDSLGLRILHPVLRSLRRNLTVRATLSALDGRTDANGVLQSEDRIRAVRLGLAYDWTDRWLGVNLLDAEMAKGIDALGATQSGSANLSVPSGRSDFTKVGLYAARLQGLGSDWSLLFAFSGQEAFDDLLVPEQYSLGGTVFGRGFDPSEILGDSGAAAKFELRFSGIRLGAGPSVLYGFYDVGKVWRRTPVDVKSSESAASAGVGWRVAFDQRLSAYVEFAKPLTRDVSEENDRDWRAYAGVRTSF